ncbi:hypothetical protein CMO91_00510 [Candidatus Woesearchaeota archaeon]|nr:hypothetical protein [Candidatus Woesearchaeota archaeon]
MAPQPTPAAIALLVQGMSLVATQKRVLDAIEDAFAPQEDTPTFCLLRDAVLAGAVQRTRAGAYVSTIVETTDESLLRKAAFGHAGITKAKLLRAVRRNPGYGGTSAAAQFDVALEHGQIECIKYGRGSQYYAKCPGNLPKNSGPPPGR